MVAEEVPYYRSCCLIIGSAILVALVEKIFQVLDRGLRDDPTHRLGLHGFLLSLRPRWQFSWHYTAGAGER